MDDANKSDLNSSIGSTTDPIGVGNNELHTVFAIDYCGQRGTAFLWADDGGSFFFTAKHLIKNAAKGDRIGVRTMPESAYFTIKEVQFGNDGSDVAAFTTMEFPDIYPIVNRHKSTWSLGQRFLFLGFPHGLENTYPGWKNRPTPLVRNGFFSGVINVNNSHDVLILDGFNNPGYSGGPVFSLGGQHERPQLVGLISGYKYETKTHSGVFRIDQGKEVQIPDTFVRANSGMIYAEGFFELNRVAQRLATRNDVPAAGNSW